jgi:hypothetical protein
VAGGANCTINVVFNPASVGLATATLSVNAGKTETKAIALSETGVALTVTLAAAPAYTTIGHPITLTWTSSNGATCMASGGESHHGWAGSKSANGYSNLTIKTCCGGAINMLSDYCADARGARLV